MAYRTLLQISGLAICAASLAIGCVNSDELASLDYVGDRNLRYYVDKSSDVSYPQVHTHNPDQVKFSVEPRTISRTNRENAKIRDVTLQEVIHRALSNNAVLRSTQGSLLASGNNSTSIYDPAIQHTNILFGGRGVEAALAEFDTRFSTSMLWGKNETIANSSFFGPSGGGTLTQDTGAFSAQLAKQFATGASFTVGNQWNYLGTNAIGQLFPSSYSGNVSASFRQPLLAGGGVEYTRIAGPTPPGLDAITGVGQGVVIARINGDITVAQFQAKVRDLLRDVELAYWDLALAYRSYDAAVKARNSVQEIWRQADVKDREGGGPADLTHFAWNEPQARDQYYEAKAAAQEALNRIYQQESNLRRLMGVELNDGEIMRPSDTPTTAPLQPDWYMCLAEALTNRVELRQQKWTIKSLEFQLTAAENQVQPRLDFVSAYRVNGFGDQLWGFNDDDSAGTDQGLRYAFESITQGNQTGWNLGFEMSVPLGFRSANAQKRNLELRVRKAREILAAQEMEVAHSLAAAYQDVDAKYQTAQSNYNRFLGALSRVEKLQKANEDGFSVRGQSIDTNDLLLRSQRSLATAEVAYYSSLIQYNQAIMKLEFEKGTLLQYNNVALDEGQWEPGAYREALRRAWARTYGLNADLVNADPHYFSSPGFVGVLEIDPHQNANTNSDYDALDNPNLPPAPVPEAEALEARAPATPAPATPAPVTPASVTPAPLTPAAPPASSGTLQNPGFPSSSNATPDANAAVSSETSAAVQETIPRFPQVPLPAVNAYPASNSTSQRIPAWELSAGPDNRGTLTPSGFQGDTPATSQISSGKSLGGNLESLPASAPVGLIHLEPSELQPLPLAPIEPNRLR